jgi:hypothetical protein
MAPSRQTYNVYYWKISTISTSRTKRQQSRLFSSFLVLGAYDSTNTHLLGGASDVTPAWIIDTAKGQGAAKASARLLHTRT